MILAIDPSGNFKSGKGQTGWFGKEENPINGNPNISFGVVRAKDFPTKKDYYQYIGQVIKKLPVKTLIIEDFILYRTSASSMINQSLETSELIGYIEGVANSLGIPIIRQQAGLIKHSLTKESVLKGIINKDVELLQTTKSKNGRTLWKIGNQRINNHILDAIRHYAYYISR